jgi:hypothetical protein
MSTLFAINNNSSFNYYFCAIWMLVHFCPLSPSISSIDAMPIQWRNPSGGWHRPPFHLYKECRVDLLLAEPTARRNCWMPLYLRIENWNNCVARLWIFIT